MNRLAHFFSSLSLSLFILLSGCENAQKVDLLIINGTLVDGTGNPSFIGDIAISGSIIKFVGNSDTIKLSPTKTIDASGMIVTPGLIDPHTHSWGDLRSRENNSNINYLTQGVTTVFNGNDGGGPFDIEAAIKNLNPEGIGTNTAFFIGHGTVREAVLGKENIQPSTDQLDEMKKLVTQGMKNGALGFSTGLYYAPGNYSTTEEVIELTKTIAPYNGVYDSHIRDESSYSIGLLEAVKETIRIGKDSDVPVHIAHIKALGVDVWDKSEEVINLIEVAQENGVKVTADQYPWIASGTSLQNALINRWVMAGGETDYLSRLNDPSLLPKIKAEMKENLRKRGGPKSILITADCKQEDLIGLHLGEIALKLEIDPIEAALKIAREGGARIASFNMTKNDLENFIVKSWVMTSSDGTKGHPRKYASFPKKYRDYVIDVVL